MYASFWPSIAPQTNRVISRIKKIAILPAMATIWESIGLFAAVLMPVWNIPLIVRIVRRKTSQDISLAWLFGVWSCMLAMLPAALKSNDAVLKAFGISNVVFFSGVVVAVLMYRRPVK
jgi:hypothetical protein